MINNWAVDKTHNYQFPEIGNDKQYVARKLKRGDIIVTELEKGRGGYLDDRISTYMQKLGRKLLKHPAPKEMTQCVHTAIVIEADPSSGRVLIADTVAKKGVRVIDLFDHNSTTLGPGYKYSYRVLRAQSEESKRIAEGAASYAERLGEKASYLERGSSKRSKNKFSYFTALKAIFANGNRFGKRAQKRVFKQIYDLRKPSEAATGGSSDRKFFCSYFVAWSLQQGKADEAYNYKNFGKMPERKNVSKWAKRNAKAYDQAKMKRELGAYAYDPKKMLPYQICHHLTAEAGFDAVMRITPPAA